MKNKINRRLVILCTMLLPLNVFAKWDSTITKDDFTDIKIGMASTLAIKGSDYLKRKYGLVVRCKGRDIDIFINWYDFLNNRNGTMDIRFDSKPAEEHKAYLSTEGTSTFFTYSSEDAIFAAMKAGSVMKIRTQNYKGTKTQTGVFSLMGFAKAYNKACGWVTKPTNSQADKLQRRMVKIFDSNDVKVHASGVAINLGFSDSGNPAITKKNLHKACSEVVQTYGLKPMLARAYSMKNFKTTKNNGWKVIRPDGTEIKDIMFELCDL